MEVLVGVALGMGSESVLRAVALGCSKMDLDRHENEIAVSEADATILLNYGLVRDDTTHVPKEEATQGYVHPIGEDGQGRFAWISREDGQWRTDHGPVTAGTTLYLDEGCSVPVRKTS